MNQWSLESVYTKAFSDEIQRASREIHAHHLCAITDKSQKIGPCSDSDLKYALASPAREFREMWDKGF